MSDKLFWYQRLVLRALAVILHYVMVMAPMGTTLYSEANTVRVAIYDYLEQCDAD